MRLCSPTRDARRLILLLAVALIGPIAITGCSAGEPSQPGEQSEAAEEPPVVEETTAVGLEDTDFGSLPWVFRPGGEVPETVQLEFVDGVATDDSVEYSLGEVVLAELTGDDRLDAAVQVTRLDGNAIDEQWYLWVATDGGPVQVTLPVARMSGCGTVTHSVRAADSGGVQIHESRRHIGEDGLACSETGGDERTRIVSAVEARNQNEWWPVQTDPVAGFGGLCPTAAEYEGVPYTGQLYAAPDAVTPEVTHGAEVVVFSLEGWPVYGEPFPGWILVGVKQDVIMSCAWAEVP